MKNKTPFSTSGRVLEDVIFCHVTSLDSKLLLGNAILHWVVDPDDIIVAKWFEPAELKELRGFSPPLPEADESFTYAVNRFSNAGNPHSHRPCN